MISREIIFQEITTYVAMLPQRHRQTDNLIALAIPRYA